MLYLINDDPSLDTPKIITLQFLTVCSYHVTYAFHCESIFYSCPNVKELLASNMRDIWSLSDSSRIRTHYHWPRPVCLIGWVFVYTLSGCGFESRWCHSSSYFEFILVFSSWLTLTQCFDRNFCDPNMVSHLIV